MKDRSTKVLVGSIIMAAFQASSYLTISNYVDPIGEMLGLGYQEISLVFTVRALSTFLFSLALPWILEKVRAKVLVAFGAFAFMAFFVSIATAQSIWPLYIGAVLYGTTFPFAGLVMGQNLVSWWVKKNAGQAVSLIAIGYSVMSFIVSPLIALGIEHFGVRTTTLIHGITVGVILLLVDIFFVYEHPERYGEHIPTAEELNMGDVVETKSGKAVLCTYPFWLIFIGTVIVNAAGNGFNNNAAVFYKTLGVDAVEASMGISVFGIVSVAWSYIYGLMSDKKGIAAANAVCMATGALVFFLGTVLKGFGGVMIMAVLMGAMNIGGLMGAMIFPHVYGNHMGNKLIGAGSMAASLGSMIGAPIFAAIHEASGSYDGYMYLSTVTIILAIGMIILGTSKRAVAVVDAASEKFEK